MILKPNRLKRSIPESLKHEYTIFPVPRPSNLPNPPPPPPICFNVGILSALNRRLIQNSYETFACDNIHRKTANIDQGKGDLSTYLPYSETVKSYFGFERFTGF